MFSILRTSHRASIVVEKLFKQRALFEIVAQYASQNVAPDHAEPAGTRK
jgi:hypothetical protein